jgi:hypothetical protein
LKGKVCRAEPDLCHNAVAPLFVQHPIRRNFNPSKKFRGNFMRTLLLIVCLCGVVFAQKAAPDQEKAAQAGRVS